MRLLSLLQFILVWGLTCAEAAPSFTVATDPLPVEDRTFPDIRVFSPRDYRGHNQIWNIREGVDGRMFFAAKEEVIAFDGLSWTHIEVPGGAYLRGLDTSPDGTVWVAGVNTFGRIRTNAQGQLKFESLRHLLPEPIENLGDFWTVHTLPDGVYFQSDLYLIRFHNDALKVWPLNEPVLTLASRWGDTLVLSCAKRLISLGPHDTFQPVPWAPEPLNRFFITDIEIDGQGGWWLGTGRTGLQHLSAEGKLEAPTGPIADYIAKSRLANLARLPDGRLIFPSYGNGVLITDEQLRPVLKLDDTNGLPANVIIQTYVDSHGIVWFGTELGIARVDMSPAIQRFGPRHGLGSTGARSVRRLAGETVFATAAGSMRLTSGDAPSDNPTFQSWPNAPIDDIINIIEPWEDGVMLGGLNSLWWVKGDRIDDLPSPSNIKAIHFSPRFPNRVFALHLSGMTTLSRVGDSWGQDRLIPEPRAELQTIAEDARGDFWLGTTNNGFWRLPYSQIAHPPDLATPLPNPPPIHYRDTHGMDCENTFCTVRNVGGAPLFLTGNGPFRYESTTDSFHRDPTLLPQIANGSWIAHHAVDSPRGGVWIQATLASNSSVTRFRQIGRSIDGRWEPLALSNLESIGRLDSLSCELLDGEEILWICGGAGVLRVNIDRYRQTPPSSIGDTILVSVTTADGRAISDVTDHTAPLAFQPGANSLRFRFGTPGLAGEPDAEHLSRLIGFAAGNEESNNTGERTFTNLPPGHYVFEAKGRTADFRWSTPAQFEFLILAPWWLTSSAKAGYVLALLVAIYGYVRWRIRRLIRERAVLESIVASRTAELAKKAQALERLHLLERDETLTARLAAETARLELLRYQLNPHFLFNALNSIRALVYTTPEAAGEMVTKLAEFCRRTLTRSREEIVTIADEIETARNYLDIEQIRWQDGLVVRLAIDPASLDCPLPQYLLLPLLENAIKYGGRTSPDTLEITIEIKLRSDVLHCTVANTGIWMEPSSNPFEDSTQIGLQNIRQRLLRHYGENARLSHSAADGWVRVLLTLPAQTPTSL